MFELNRQERLSMHFQILGCQAALNLMPHAAGRYLDAKDVCRSIPLQPNELDGFEAVIVQAYQIQQSIAIYYARGGAREAVTEMDTRCFKKPAPSDAIALGPSGSSEGRAVQEYAEEFHFTGKGGNA